MGIFGTNRESESRQGQGWQDKARRGVNVDRDPNFQKDQQRARQGDRGAQQRLKDAKRGW